MVKDCVFCEIVEGRAPAEHVFYTPKVIGIIPLDPVTPGHVIFIPKKHVKDALEDRSVTALTMKVASRYGSEHASSDSMNLITSVGEEATQSIRHLHIHLVPRRYGDLLSLPWTPNREVTSSYRSVDEQGKIWCQSHSPGEVVKMSTGHKGQLDYQKYTYISTNGNWYPWDPS